MTEVFGILNITPDSFSDGGKYFELKNAIKIAEEMLKDGVYAIDVGAESTRPNAKIIGFEEEIKRLSKILPELIKLGVKISLDTRNPETAKFGLDLGVSIINDVSGFADEKMISLLCEYKVKGVFMHSLTVPSDPTICMSENGIEMLYSIKKWAEDKLKLLAERKIPKEDLIFDPGIGFGKTGEQSLFLLKNIEYFKILNLPVLVGHSRKSFLKETFSERFEEKEVDTYEKDLMTSIFSALLFGKVEFLRLHNTKIPPLLH